jgi:hypothetical protein
MLERERAASPRPTTENIVRQVNETYQTPNVLTLQPEDYLPQRWV